MPGADVQDWSARLRELGIFRLPVPTPFPGDPVNVYAIEDADGRLTLVDTGVAGVAASCALGEGLWRIGAGFSDIGRIIVSHGHADHFGAARWLKERSGRDLAIFAHPHDFPRILQCGPRWRDQSSRYEALFARHGVPRDLFSRFDRRESSYDECGARVSELHPLRHGDVLRFARFEASVLHLPGHTPGLVCLLDETNGLFFSNDHLLEGVTPGLEVYLGPDGEELPARSLEAHLASLRVTRALDVRAVLPGHGAPFSGHREAIDTVLRVHDRRQARLREVLSHRPMSAFALAQAIFPRTAGAELMVALAQVLGSLWMLQARSEVVREDGERVVLFRTR